MEKPSFIVVEGPDGVGKTKLTSRLATQLGYTAYKTPPESFRRIRALYDAEGVDPMVRFFFYEGSLHTAVQEIQGIISGSSGVVCDRFTDSLRVYHEALSGRSLSKVVGDCGFPTPDLTIVLTADPCVLSGRRTGRGQTHDTRLEQDYALMAEVNTRFGKIVGDNILNINTTNITLEEVERLCLQRLSQ